MATTTTNLGLTKPAGTDAPDIAVINANMDKIDTNLSKKTDLASTASGKGASLIGIQDSAGKITATTVEGALAELAANRAISYDFGNITAANINEVSAALIAKFNTCANGAHNYVGVWSGKYYFGGTIHKFGTDIGVLTFFPSITNSSQASMNIYNGGGGWNSTSI